MWCRASAPRAGHETGGPLEGWASGRGPFMVKRAASGSAGPLPLSPSAPLRLPPTRPWPMGPSSRLTPLTSPRRHGRSCLAHRLYSTSQTPSGFRQLQIRPRWVPVSGVSDDRTVPTDPFAGYRPRRGEQVDTGLGLWITNHVCSRVTLTRTPEGFTVRLVAGTPYPVLPASDGRAPWRRRRQTGASRGGGRA